MTKRMTKKDYAYCGIVCGIVMIMILVLTKCGEYIYGSTLDWDTQHFVIPDYFRKRFYETKEFFPSFAFNLGSGQNIYNFSYYGLLNPIIWIAYLLPFVSMRTYLIASTILIVFFSIGLIYRWLRGKYSSEVCFVATFLFSMSSSWMMHSHRHVMFINYMPFLILALEGVDRYFEKRKKGLLIINVFLIIMASYFFSVGAICAIVIYGIYVYLKTVKKFEFKNFSKEAMIFAGTIVVAVMMAGVMLIPTGMTLFSGRAETNNKVSMKSLIIPWLKIDNLMYSVCSIGCTAFLLVSLVYLLYTKKKENIFLGTTFLLIGFFQIIVYILNGMMYVDGKVLIPFLPLSAFIIAKYAHALIENKLNLNKWIKICGLAILVSIIFSVDVKEKILKLYIGESISIFISLLLYKKIKKKYVLFVVSMCVAMISCYKVSVDDELCKKETNEQKQILSEIEDASDYISQKDKDSLTMYRTYIDESEELNNIHNMGTLKTTMYSSICDGGYNEFYFKKFGMENVYRNDAMISWGRNDMFNIFSGTRYIIAESCNLAGYEEIKRFSDDVAVYENKDVLPIGYVTSNIMNKETFDKLKFPYSNEALLKYAIVEGEKNTDEYKSNIKKYEESDYTWHKQDDFIEVKEKENNKFNIHVDAKKLEDFDDIDNMYSDVKLKFKNNNIKNKLLIFKMNVDNSFADNVVKLNGKESKGDIFVSVEGTKNKLTNPKWKYYNKNTSFEYVISKKTYNKNIDFKFSNGTYDISGFEAYSYDYENLANIKNEVDEFFISEYNGDSIKGNITVKKDGYFKLSIPYNKGFEIEVDGKKVDYKKINDTFIGFKIEKGKHNIVINYTSPGLKYGKITSLIGILMFGLIVGVEKKEYFKKVFLK